MPSLDQGSGGIPNPNSFISTFKLTQSTLGFRLWNLWNEFLGWIKWVRKSILGGDRGNEWVLEFLGDVPSFVPEDAPCVLNQNTTTNTVNLTLSGSLWSRTVPPSQTGATLVTGTLFVPTTLLKKLTQWDENVLGEKQHEDEGFLRVDSMGYNVIKYYRSNTCQVNEIYRTLLTPLVHERGLQFWNKIPHF